MGPREGARGESAGKCNCDRWLERMDLQAFLRDPMCGPVGVASVASLTSRPVSKECTRRLFLRRTKGGIQNHPPRVVKKESRVFKKKNLKRLRAKVELLSKQ